MLFVGIATAFMIIAIVMVLDHYAHDGNGFGWGQER